MHLSRAAAVGSLLFVAAGCSSGSAWRMVSLNEPVTVNGSKLVPLTGQRAFSGDVVVTFIGAEKAGEIVDRACGTGNMTPRGRWVIIYYSVKNDLNEQIQPATQLADDFVLTDAKGRTWTNGDYGDYCFLSANAAEARGYSGPESDVGAGFSGTTAIVFDAPTDANGLQLEWKAAATKVNLGLK